MTAAAIPAAATSEQLTSNPDRPLGSPALWSLTDTNKVLTADSPDWINVARRFVVDGDHWQDGDAWVGPSPSLGDGESARFVMNLILRQFTSRNVLAEASERYTNGLVGFEPPWSLTPKRSMQNDEEPNEKEQALIDEAEAALTDWWDRFQVAPLFWHAVYQMTWASRGPMRLYLSRRAFVKDGASTGVQRQKDLQSALALILLDIPSVKSCTVYVDPSTKEETGVYAFKDATDNSDRAEVCFVGDSGQTVLRTIGGVKPTDIMAPLGGHLTIHQMRRPRLITEQAFQLQRALNFALSIVPRTLETAGFLERIMLNVQLPGRFVDDNNAPSGKRFVPDPNLVFGAGTTQALTGVVTRDVDGKESVATPSVNYREPVAPTGALESKNGLYAALLEEVDQAHVLLSQEATPSGRSREEARADFVSSLRTGKHAVDHGGRWLIGAALALAEYLTGKPGRFTSQLRVRFDARLDSGPLSTTERQQNQAEWKEGLLSRESVQLRGGVVDPDAEAAVIMSEPGAQLDLARRQAETMSAWLLLGASPQLAAEVAGVDEDVAQRLERDLFPVDRSVNPGGSTGNGNGVVPPVQNGGRPEVIAANAGG